MYLCNQLKTVSVMTVTSSKEVISNQGDYFDWAVEDEVSIQEPQRVYYEPDEDFYRSISADELLKRIYKDIERKYTNYR